MINKAICLCIMIKTDSREIEIAMMYYLINAKIVRLHGYIFHEYDSIQVLTNSMLL